jgi:isopenicillin N synthase-like dioxygenase
MTIDYSKLNDRIVEQAHQAAKNYFSLSEDEKQKLFQNKIDRAKAMLELRDKNTVYFQIED